MEAPVGSDRCYVVVEEEDIGDALGRFQWLRMGVDGELGPRGGSDRR